MKTPQEIANRLSAEDSLADGLYEFKKMSKRDRKLIRVAANLAAQAMHDEIRKEFSKARDRELPELAIRSFSTELDTGYLWRVISVDKSCADHSHRSYHYTLPQAEEALALLRASDEAGQFEFTMEGHN